MRHEEPSSRSKIAEAFTSRVLAWSWAARVWPRVRAWVRPAMLASLATITSLALAAYASVWLVPFYLIVMGLVLGVPIPAIGRREIEPRVRVDDGSEVGAVSRAAGDTGLLGAASAVALELEPTSETEIASTPEPDVDADPGKAKRGRGRPRKAKAVPLPVAEVETQSATWVRVGPGQFVRADRLPGVLVQEEASTVYPREQVEEADDLDSAEESSIEVDGDAGPEPVVPEVETFGDNGIAPDVPSGETRPEERLEGITVAVEGETIDSDPSLDPSAETISATEEHDLGASLMSLGKPIRWIRSGRPSRIIPGVRSVSRRSARGAGRFVGVDRTHPPRSPPRPDRCRWWSGGQGFGLV